MSDTTFVIRHVRTGALQMWNLCGPHEISYRHRLTADYDTKEFLCCPSCEFMGVYHGTMEQAVTASKAAGKYTPAKPLASNPD
jgi:hypothetical protein